MLCLASDTDPAWVHAAPKDPAALLSDHAQCEKKAALSALSLTQAFAHDTEVVTELAAFAREELEHLSVLSAPAQARPGARARRQGPVFAQLINAAADVTHHLVDRLPIAALIEAQHRAAVILSSTTRTPSSQRLSRSWRPKPAAVLCAARRARQ